MKKDLSKLLCVGVYDDENVRIIYDTHSLANFPIEVNFHIFLVAFAQHVLTNQLGPSVMT